MKQLIILFLMGCLSVLVNGQEENLHKQKLRFTSVNSIGLLNGETGTSFDISTLNGIKINGWTIGLGAAIDHYADRSIPVFAGVQKEVVKKSYAPFIYAKAGINNNWLNHVQKEQKGLPYATTPGAYADAGLGVALKTKSSLSFLISAGFSYKQSKEEVPLNWWIMPWPMPGPGNVETQHLNSHYRRIVVRFGIQL